MWWSSVESELCGQFVSYMVTAGVRCVGVSVCSEVGVRFWIDTAECVERDGVWGGVCRRKKCVVEGSVEKVSYLIV